jgi:hypothetical protein
MRIALLTVLAVLLGASIGLSITWYEFRGVGEHFQHMSRTKAPIAPGLREIPPEAVVEGGATYDFGVLNHDQTRETTFVIRNEGGMPLTLTWAPPSCGMCIENKHNFTEKTVPSGESCEVIITFSTKKPGPKFHEVAYLTTNDPGKSSLRLEIKGDVIKAVRLEPETLALNSILSSEASTASVKLVGYHSDKLELVKHEFTNPNTSSLFEVTSKKLDAEGLKNIEHAKTGFEFQIKIKPGLPIGPVAQNIVFNVRTDADHTVELPLTGTVVGDMSIIGKNVDSNESRFSLGLIPKGEGRTAEIYVLVKGPHREDVKLSVGTVDPPQLKVSVGEPSSFAEGKIIKFPIQVSIPKGTPPVIRLGNSQGKVARIVLNTTHPHSKELAIDVRFAVD